MLLLSPGKMKYSGIYRRKQYSYCFFSTSYPVCIKRQGNIINEISQKVGRNARSELSGLAGEVFFNHKSNLKGYGVVELAQVKSGELAYFLKSVNEGVSVNEKLS